MVVKIEPLFAEVLLKCPVEFQLQFRKVYQQLKVVDKPLEVKNMVPIKGGKGYYKLTINKSKIGIRFTGKAVHINTFLYCEYFNDEMNY